MNPSSPRDARKRGRFWLALSLSTVTALAVAVPLAFRAAGAGDLEGPATSQVTTPQAQLAEVEPVEDSVVAEETTSSTSSPLPAIAVRADVEAEFVIQAGGQDDISAATTTIAPATTSSTAAPATSVPEDTASSTPDSTADNSGEAPVEAVDAGQGDTGAGS